MSGESQKTSFAKFVGGFVAIVAIAMGIWVVAAFFDPELIVSLFEYFAELDLSCTTQMPCLLDYQ